MFVMYVAGDTNNRAFAISLDLSTNLDCESDERAQKRQAIESGLID